jgi:uncharacterized protein (DUF2147 family)
MQVAPYFSRSLKYIAVLALVFLGTAAARADQPGAGQDVAGWWVTADGKAAVVIAPCDGQLCGSIEWLRQPLDSAGKPKTDIHNPDASLRPRLLCGLTILGNFTQDGGGGWKGGWIYDPASGNTYKSIMHVADDGRLHVRGYVGIPMLGRSEIMTRPATKLQHCVVGSAAAQPAAAAPAP